MILGPKDDGTYVVEFRTAEGEALAISIPRTEGARDPALPGADALRPVRPGSAERVAARRVTRPLSRSCGHSAAIGSGQQCAKALNRFAIAAAVGSA